MERGPQLRRVLPIVELGEGVMRQHRVNEQELLIANIDGKVYVTSAFCTHEETPLADGVPNGSQIMCPSHFAVFDLKTGEAVEQPIIGTATSLRIFAVTVSEGWVYVEV